MELKTYFAQDASGNIMPGASVTVYLANTTTLATGLQDESGSPLSNPFTADSSAKVSFYAPDGLYDITVVGNGRTVTIRAQFVSVDGASVLRSDLAATGGSALVGSDDDAGGSLWTTVAGFIAFLLSSLGASVIGFIQSASGAVARSIQDKLRETVSPEDFGADGVDDTQALKRFFAAIAAGAAGEMQPRIYKYSLASGGTLSVDCAKFVLNARGASIQCIAYPSAGAGVQIEFVKIRAAEIHLDCLDVDGGWQQIANRVDNYCVAGGYFNYMHGLAISADGGFIDNITVHDCEGIGFTTEAGAAGLSNVQIGRITTHHNWMIGTDIRNLSGYVENVTIGQLIAHHNGTRGVGWVGVNFGDCKSASGTRNVTVGSILSYEGGGSGVGVGQYGNPANGDVSGAADVSIGVIEVFGNTGHGVELYASLNTHVGHIKAVQNGRNGVYLERSDTNNLFGYVGQIDSISSSFNGEDGVIISGWRNVQIGSSVTWNNGASGAGFSGMRVYSANLGGTLDTGELQIGSIRTFDDRDAGSKTQDYGISFVFFGQPASHIRIGSLDSVSNNAQDVAWLAFGSSKPVSIGQSRWESIAPDYADNSRVLFIDGQDFYQRWRTTDATPFPALIARPKPGVDCIVEYTVTGRNSAGTTVHIARDLVPYKWTGTGFQKQTGTVQSPVFKTGATDSYTNEFGSAISAYVVGIAGTTIDWELRLRFSSGVDYDFAI